jgi:hypothetical protein
MAPTKPDLSCAIQHRDILAPVSNGIKKYTAHPLPLRIDLDKYCGVICENTSSACLNKLRDCKTHSKAQKLAVPGRASLPKVDLDKQCGVDVDGCPCPKKLRDCQTHSRVQKRAVIGRSCSYDMLIVAPAWAVSSRAAYPTVDNGEGSSKDWPRVKAQIEQERAADVDRSTTPQLDIPILPATGKGKQNAEDSGVSGLLMNIPLRPKGKKRGPKAWTPLENESKCTFLVQNRPY